MGTGRPPRPGPAQCATVSVNDDTPPASEPLRASPPVHRTPRHFLLWFAILFVITQVPLYAVRYPDMDDYPGHLARLHVLANLDSSEALRKFYVESPGLAPNLALDILGVPLGKAVGFEAGVKLFASISSLLLATGTIALSFALGGSVTFLALGSLLFSHNAFLHYGTFNFLFGTGLALWLLAGWIVVRRSHPAGPVQLIGFSLGAVLLYLCHLAATGLFLLGVFAWESRRMPSPSTLRELARNIAIVCVLGLPALCVHAFLYAPGVVFQEPYPDVRILVLLIYKAVFLPLSIPTVAIQAHPVVQAIAMAAIYLGLRWSHGRGLFSFSPQGLRIAAATGVAMLLLPPIGFGSEMVDMRMGLPLVLVLWASLVQPRNAQSRTAAALVPWAIAAGVTVISAAALLKWSQADPMQGDLRQAMLSFEEGSKVAVVKLADDRPIFTPHSACWSAVDRSTFVSSMFVRPFQPVTLSFRDGLAPIAALARLNGDAKPPPRETLVGRYDYAVVFGTEASTARYSADSATLYRSDAVRLIRLR